MLQIDSVSTWVARVLLCWQAFQFLEMFAGDGNCSRIMRYCRVPTASADLRYAEHIRQALDAREDPMDICTPAGFAFLSLNTGVFFLSFGVFLRAMFIKLGCPEKGLCAISVCNIPRSFLDSGSHRGMNTTQKRSKPFFWIADYRAC